MDGRMTVESRFAIEMGDLAVLSNTWTLSAGGEQMSVTTSEVARRQSDGSWLYIIDHPYDHGRVASRWRSKAAVIAPPSNACCDSGRVAGAGRHLRRDLDLERAGSEHRSKVGL
jgi:hypothetical protein